MNCYQIINMSCANALKQISRCWQICKASNTERYGGGCIASNLRDIANSYSITIYLRDKCNFASSALNRPALLQCAFLGHWLPDRTCFPKLIFTQQRNHVFPYNNQCYIVNCAERVSATVPYCSHNGIWTIEQFFYSLQQQFTSHFTRPIKTTPENMLLSRINDIRSECFVAI